MMMSHLQTMECIQLVIKPLCVMFLINKAHGSRGYNVGDIYRSAISRYDGACEIIRCK